MRTGRRAEQDHLVRGLLELSEVLVGCAPIRERMAEVCRLVTVLLDCDRSSIFIPDGDHFRFFVNHESPPDVQLLFEQTSFSVRHPLLAHALEEDSCVVMDDTDHSALMSQIADGQAGMRSMVVAPMRGPAEPNQALLIGGFITAEYSNLNRHLEPDNAAYLLAMARSAGTALSEQAARDHESDLLRRAQRRLKITEQVADWMDTHMRGLRSSALRQGALDLLLSVGLVTGACLTSDADGTSQRVATAGEDPLAEDADPDLAWSIVVDERRSLRVHALRADSHPDTAETLRRNILHIAAGYARMESMRKLNQTARTDQLTGLPNRRALQSRLADAEARGTPTTVMLLDLDNFKLINDSLGHDAGDATLKLVSERLRTTAAPHFVARYGGDEFHIVIEDDHGPDTASELADQITLALGEPLPPHLGSRGISCSVGIASTASGSCSRDLLRDADIAMYTAKDSSQELSRHLTR